MMGVIGVGVEMMPVIRISDELFRRLQTLATPLIDTPASVIEKLLDMHESKGSTNSPAVVAQKDSRSRPALSALTANASYETYENRNNPHVTIHKAGCSQLRKHGGVHRHGQGGYRAHETLAEAESYARKTGLPIKFCGYCDPRAHLTRIEARDTHEDTQSTETVSSTPAVGAQKLLQ